MANRWAKADLSSYKPAQPLSSPSKALKALVRAGIPAELRPDLWLRFSGGAARKAAARPGLYAALHRRAATSAHSGAVDTAELSAELTRAFGMHPFLSSAKGTRAVLRLLEVSTYARSVPLGGQLTELADCALCPMQPCQHVFMYHACFPCSVVSQQVVVWRPAWCLRHFLLVPNH